MGDEDWTHQRLEDFVVETFGVRKSEDISFTGLCYQRFLQLYGRSLDGVLDELGLESIVPIQKKYGLRQRTSDDTPSASGRSSPSPTDDEGAAEDAAPSEDGDGQGPLVLFSSQPSTKDFVEVEKWQKKYLTDLLKFFATGEREDRVLVDLSPPDGIRLSGDRADRVFVALLHVREEADKVLQTYDHKVLKVDKQHIGRLVGREHKNIRDIQKDTKAKIVVTKKVMPKEFEGLQDVVVDGKKDCVAAAENAIMDFLQKITDHITVQIVEKKDFIAQLIGGKGKGKKRLETKFPGVKLRFSGPGAAEAYVALVGSKKDVQEAEKHIQALLEKMREEEWVEKGAVETIPWQVHRLIRGHQYANIRKIQAKHAVRMDFKPKSDQIMISGRRKALGTAAEALRSLHKDIVKRVVEVPFRLHGRIIGKGGRNLEWILESEVAVDFPPKEEGSSSVTVTGLSGRADQAVKRLKELAKHLGEQYAERTFVAPPGLYGLIVGKDGRNLAKLREGNDSVRIDVPREGQDEGQGIRISGPPDEVSIVYSLLSVRLDSLSELYGDGEDLPQPPPRRENAPPPPQPPQPRQHHREAPEPHHHREHIFWQPQVREHRHRNGHHDDLHQPRPQAEIVPRPRRHRRRSPEQPPADPIARQAQIRPQPQPQHMPQPVPQPQHQQESRCTIS